MRAMRLAALFVLTASPGTSVGQTSLTGGWLIEVIGEPVSPSNPTTTVRVSAYFPSHLWALNYGGFDLIGADSNAAFSNFMLPAPLGPRPPGVHGCVRLLVGNSGSGRVDDVSFLQINIAGCLAHAANPLPIFEAQWTTTDFTPREVQLETLNTPAFHVFPDPGATLNTIELVALNQFRHGSAVIQVIPAPAGTLVLLGVTALCVRRQRAGSKNPAAPLR